MSGINHVIIQGHLGRDPELRFLPDGKPVATLSIATSKTFKDKAGEKQERTEWHRIVLFGRSAEVANEFLKKGSMPTIIGELRTRKWTDKEGVERYSTEIVGRQLALGANKSGNAATAAPESSPPVSDIPPADDLGDDDLPS